jgi:formate hydrogenlyase transcriptional activator
LIGSQSTYNLANVEEDAVEPPPMDRLHSQYQALLEISEALASHRELDQLFSELAPRLHRVVQFDFANLLLYDPDRKTLQSHVFETPDPAYSCAPGECPMETPGGFPSG